MTSVSHWPVKGELLDRKRDPGRAMLRPAENRNDRATRVRISGRGVYLDTRHIGMTAISPCSQQP